MPTRFVILHHFTSDGEHWDLMLEWGDLLRTWQLQHEPSGVEAMPIPARRIGDHRLAYLTYEGPLSRDRGHVTRVNEGVFDAEELGGGSLSVTLTGRRLRGTFHLIPTTPDSVEWRLEHRVNPS